MSDLTQSMAIAASGMEAQGLRLRRVAENIANADTPGYRRKLTHFEAELTGGQTTGAVKLGPVTLDARDLPRIHAPGHPLADENGYRLGSNVETMVEIADAREAQRSYEANLKTFDQARKMSSALLDLLRR